MSESTDNQQPDLQTQFDTALRELRGKQRLFVVEYLKDLHGTRAAMRAGYSEKTAREQASRMLTFVNIAKAVSLGMELKCLGPAEVLARLSDQARGSMADFLRVDEEEITVEMGIAVLTDDERFKLAMGGAPEIRKLLTPVSHNDDEASDTSEHIDSSDTSEANTEVNANAPKAVRIHYGTIKRSVARLDLLAAADKLHLIKKYSIDEKGKVAIELYDAQAANKLIGQKHGLFVEKHEHSGPKGGPIPISAVDLAEARELARQFEQGMTDE